MSTDERTEPRFQVGGPRSDRADLRRGCRRRSRRARRSSSMPSVLGYPVQSLGDIKPGEYWVQGLLHVYETFTRSDGHTVKLPPDRGEGQQWSSAPGNLYSAPVKVRIDPSSDRPLRISLDKKIPPLPGSARHQVREAHQDPERAADEVLGPADVSRRARGPARGMGHASERALPARDLPRALSARGVRMARDAARSEAAAGRRRQHREVLPERPRGRVLRQVRLRPHAAGVRLRVLQAVDRAGTSRA